jgi:hypothetical protein
MITDAFRAHPRTVGESYREHQRAAFYYARSLLGAGLAAAVHAVFPWLFESTASRTVVRVHAHMQSRLGTRLR